MCPRSGRTAMYGPSGARINRQQPILAPPPQPPGCYSQPSGCYSQFDSQFPFSPPKARAPMPDRKVHHCMIVFLCIFAAVPRQAGLLRSLQFHIAGRVSVVPAMQMRVCAIACRPGTCPPVLSNTPQGHPVQGRFHRHVANRTSPAYG